MCLLNFKLIKMFNNGGFFFLATRVDFRHTVSALWKNTYRSLSLITHASFTFTTFSRIPYPDELTEVLSADL